MNALLLILQIFGIALDEATKLVKNPDLAVADSLERIALAAAQAYQQEAGQPIDLSKIAPPAPLP